MGFFLLLFSMGTKTFWVRDFSDWDRFVQELLIYAAGQKVFVLQGEIGAGKTTFVQAFCRALGVQEEVTSPTFALINQYLYSEEETGGESRVYHLDLYRLKDQEEALDLGIEDLLAGEDYCFIEWPELIASLLPEEVIVIKIMVVEKSERKILFL